MTPERRTELLRSIANKKATAYEFAKVDGSGIIIQYTITWEEAKALYVEGDTIADLGKRTLEL